ncbi:adenosylcobinamide amidohydrolase [Candidatus Poriferisodalis sp.]|uniref:adenosylcobinamide amidohydrolase n=1 Tax=Candidatus Poriferisodalis sp. TaxID=3101277 RepID=UPI003B01FE8D
MRGRRHRTATDAVVAAWPAAARRQRFGGPRSEWGQRLALAVHSAVQAGLPAGLA